MLDPYRMVVVNTLGSLILIVGILFYRFIYPKRSINLFILLILISFLPIISIFRVGAYESGDFNIHIYRTMAFYDSLKEGNIMPSWAKDLNATYGYPLFIFNYTLPYYIVSLFHWIGLSFIQSLKLFLAFNIVLSGIFMFLFAKKLFKNDLPAFVSSIFYIFAPYHLIDVHFKVVIGEILFFTILPLPFLFLYKLQNRKTLFSILLVALSFAGLVMTHVVIALFTVIPMLFYALFCSIKNNLKTLPLYAIAAVGISLLISLYAWLGPLLLSKYSLIQNIKLGTVYFPSLQDILYSPWRMGLLFQGPTGQISHLLGYTHLFIIISQLVFLYRKKVSKKIYSEVLFWLSVSFIIIFLILPYSKPLWESLPFIKTVGSHRLLILASFTSSILAGYFVLSFKKKWVVYLLVVVSIGSTILNWGQRRVIPEIDDGILQRNLWKSTSEGEAHIYANTKWVDIKNPWFSKLPKSNIEVIKGEGEIKILKRTSIEHTYIVSAKTQLSLKENTLYFPGWEVQVNGKNIQIGHTNNGIITFKVQPGKQLVQVIYSDTPTYKLLKSISFACLLLALTLLTLKTFFKIMKYSVNDKIVF